MSSTSARLLSLLSLLQARRDWPGALLAERLEVSTRTVRRDVDRLRELGYPIAAMRGPDGGYRLEAGTDLPPLVFDDEQAVALVVALQTATVTGAGVEEGAARALATLRQVLPTRLRHRVDALRVTAVGPASHRSGDRVDPELIVALSAAVHAHDVLRFDYGDDPTRRRAEPHHLVTRAGRWYLLAWDLDRGDWRTFRVDRIAPTANTGPRFVPREVPGGDVAAFVASRFKGADGTGDWPCRGEVIVDLPSTVVAAFTTDEVVEALGDCRSRIVAGAWSWIGLAAALGRFDAPVEVVGPPELREAFAQLADRYGSAGEVD